MDGHQQSIASMQEANLFNLPAPFPGEFWVVNGFVAKVSRIWKTSMKKMQRDNITFEEQERYAKDLEKNLKALFGDDVRDLGTAPRPTDLLRTVHGGVTKQSELGPFRIRHEAVLEAMCDKCSTAMKAFPTATEDEHVPIPEHLEGANQDAALTASIRFFLTLLHGSRLTTLDRPDRQQTGSASAPPSSPAGFTKLQTADVGTLARRNMQKLRRVLRGTEDQITQTSMDEHLVLQQRLQDMDDEARRKVEWHELPRLSHLHHLATISTAVLPHTCQVEGDFSMIGAFADNRGRMGVEGIQGIMHARQLHRLRDLVAGLKARRAGEAQARRGSGGG
eukprot:GHVU01086705.1.p1 GENE.GHVU01086705.1~~GHVU01086705.1.p1  ORF type:complete len:335 (+),score=55.02 GHVU01086705.1:139-1143(+)